MLLEWSNSHSVPITWSDQITQGAEAAAPDPLRTTGKVVELTTDGDLQDHTTECLRLFSTAVMAAKGARWGCMNAEPH